MKRSLVGLSLLAGFALCVACSNTNAQELLLNPSMDLTVPYIPNSANPNNLAPQPASWTVVGTRTNTGSFTDVLSSEPWAGPSPTPVTTNGSNAAYNTGMGCGNGNPDSGPDCGVFFKPFQGNVTTGDLATGHLRQSVLAEVGQAYEFSVWARAEANYSGFIDGSPTKTEIGIDFLGPGFVLISSSTLDLEAAGLGNGYAEYSVTGTAPDGSVFVRPRISMIDAYSNPAGGGQAFLVDDASLRAIPEPSSLILAGLSVVGALSIRRRG
jgi:hypothetical protein